MYERRALVPPTILVVEDSPDDAMIVGLTFQESGIVNPLVFVEDGSQAVDYLKGRGDYTDRNAWPLPMLVILDINLPKCDGFEVLRASEAIREANDIHVVVLSVSDSPADIERAISLGATKVLRKPIEPAMLLQVTSEIDALSLLIVPKRG